MKPKSLSIAISIITLLALLFEGFWVGVNETFGGYGDRKDMFLYTSLLCGLLVAVLLNRQWKVHFVFVAAFFVLSHCIYRLGTAFGEAFYCNPDNLADFAHTVVLSLNNQL